MGFLLDTNVVSELRRRRPDANVLRWLDAVDGSRLHLSVLVLGELEQGIERLRPRDPESADALAAWLSDLRHRFGERVIPVDDAVASAWGRLNARRPLPVVDGLLAATATVHDLTLVTRNVRDVADAGVRVLDPFAG